jgi:hypothetical protein
MLVYANAPGTLNTLMNLMKMLIILEWMNVEDTLMIEIQSALERVIIELDSWCDNWTPASYNDPRISLRQIANRARDVLEEEKND